MLQTATTTWNLGPTHSVAEFKVKHIMISNVEGQIRRPQRDIHRRATDPSRQGSLGQYQPGALGDYKDQPQRLRPHLERRVRLAVFSSVTT